PCERLHGHLQARRGVERSDHMAHRVNGSFRAHEMSVKPFFVSPPFPISPTTTACLRRDTRFCTVRFTVEKRVSDASKKFDEHLRGVAYRNGRGAALFVAAFTAALW